MRNFFLSFAITALAVFSLTWFLSIFFEPISGDLARIGGYAERDFGWNGTQPVVQVQSNDAAGPDVLVLGDSFSERNLWQSTLALKFSKTTRSFDIRAVGCTDNWLTYFLNDTHAKTVIVETAEREYLNRFADTSSCAPRNLVPFKSVAGPSPAIRPTSAWPPDWHIYYALEVGTNRLELRLKEGASMRGEVINAPIERACGNFSNRRSDRLLYYPDDEKVFGWERGKLLEAALNIRRIQNAIVDRGKQFVLILIPDKMSAYHHCLKGGDGLGAKQLPDIMGALAAAGVNAPDLQKLFKEKMATIVDLYLPDDTHLSSSGYDLMEKAVEPFVDPDSRRVGHAILSPGATSVPAFSLVDRREVAH